MSDSERFRLHRDEPAPRGSRQALRIALRVVLLVAIVYLAAAHGYGGQRGLLLVLVAVLWALALPFVLRGFARYLEGTRVTGRRRTALLATAALLLLAVFAADVRLLIAMR